MSTATTRTTNYRGEWVPSIPLPFYGLRKMCRCGRKFWTEESYRGHYAYAHILGMVAPADKKTEKLNYDPVQDVRGD